MIAAEQINPKCPICHGTGTRKVYSPYFQMLVDDECLTCFLWWVEKPRDLKIGLQKPPVDFVPEGLFSPGRRGHPIRPNLLP